MTEAEWDSSSWKNSFVSSNLVIGDNLGGFEGMFLADMYNHDNSATTTFLITYKDGSTAVKEVENGTSLYRKYIRYCK